MLCQFAKVFDPEGDPLAGMMGMMSYKNFVSEEWSHVLAWDLLVGRFIWLDGLRRGVFTSHSVLLTNLIGPPGLLLHFLTCLLTGKGLPPVESVLSMDGRAPDGSESVSPPSELASKNKAAKTAFRAEALIQPLLSDLLSSTSDTARASLLALCDDSTVWEYTNDPAACVGRDAIAAMLSRRAKRFPANARIVVDKVAEGSSACGFTFHLAQDGVVGKGLRSTIFVEFQQKGADKTIAYVREVAEPLFKPGAATSKLLRAVVSEAVKKDPTLAIRPPAPAKRATTSAPDLVKFLWTEVNGSDKQLTLSLFDDNIVYDDFNFPKPFVGKEEVSEFLDEFDIPGITFIPEKFTDGRDGSDSCCFTWRVQLAGVAQSTRGISFYETNPAGTLVTYINDIPEPAIKPAPLQLIASILRPGLRRFKSQ